jgi:hypothetical protein
LRPRELGAAFGAVAIAAVLVAPLYYTRYYKPLGEVFPQAMEWRRSDDLRLVLKLRDSNRWAFFLHMVRLPAEPITGTQEPVRDSFIHSIWLQTWKRDTVLGEEGRLALTVSDFYVRAGGLIAFGATLLFSFRRQRLPAAWRDLGRVLLVVSVAFCVALLWFGWKYPLWDWRVFKAKYITPAILWVPYCVAIVVVSVAARAPWWNRLGAPAGVFVLLIFMFTNHVLPVY